MANFDLLRDTASVRRHPYGMNASVLMQVDVDTQDFPIASGSNTYKVVTIPNKCMVIGLAAETIRPATKNQQTLEVIMSPGPEISVLGVQVSSDTLGSYDAATGSYKTVNENHSIYVRSLDDTDAKIKISVLVFNLG
jgi:trans-2-enoyl-CoA reductase